MKPNKSPESTEVTPSKKKLKQARLPFKVISDVSPSPPAPQTRKRKLSEADSEPVTKVGRLSKENDVTEDPVVISDEECRETSNDEVGRKTHNPYVKLVDAARKKKLQKSKTSKNKKNGRKTSRHVSNGSQENSKKTESCDDKDEMEMMDVDEPVTEDITIKPSTENGAKKDSDKSNNTSPKKSETKKSLRSSKKSIENEIITLEDSNDSSDVNIDESKTTAKIIDKSAKQESTPNQVNRRESPRKKCTTPTDSSSKSPEKPKTSSKNSESLKAQNSPTKVSPKKTSPKKDESEQMVTPKRSTRTKAKVEETINITPTSKLDKSVASTPSTPKSVSSATKSQDGSISEPSTPTTNLTPKQLQKKHESAKKREEREKEKSEREKKRQQEKEERAKQKQEKEDQRKREREEKEEAKRKEREEKEEQKKREREEKEQQREMEKKLKEEKEEQKRKEREEKEDQKKKEREAREEERRKKQEALDLEKQEQELKKKKAAEAFANFFVPKQKSDKGHGTVLAASMNNMLSSFTIKVDMRLAPTIRVSLSDEQREDLTNFIKSQKENELYVQRLKAGSCKPLSSGKTWPLTDKDDDDVQIIEDELPPIEGAEIITCESAQKEKLRPKLLSFHDNRRPPYWGTWRKKSQWIKPRNPFGQEKSLDYDADSGDDWEEEAEGESLDGSVAGSDDEQENDEYEVDNDMFVPHGYLSDEEATMDEDDVLSLSPETQKERLKHLEDEFESELKKPTEKLKPRQYGILFETKDGGKPEKCVDALWNYFCKFSMIMDDPTPLLQPAKESEDGEKKKIKKKKQQPKDCEQSPKTEKKRKAKPEKQESKKPKVDAKKNTPEVKKNQPGINSFLKKITTT